MFCILRSLGYIPYVCLVMYGIILTICGVCVAYPRLYVFCYVLVSRVFTLIAFNLVFFDFLWSWCEMDVFIRFGGFGGEIWPVLYVFLVHILEICPGVHTF